jgi:nitroreductase
VCTDRRQLQELSQVWRYAGHVATSAATVALIAPEVGDCWIEYDLGQATMSMMLAAADLGIGSGHASVSDQDLARRILGHPEDRRCAYLVAFGYPAVRPLRPVRNPNRSPLDDVVHRGHW